MRGAAGAEAGHAAPVPVAVLAGFLGAGKTTLLNALLRNPALGQAAVIVNEFGAIGIDHDLVERVEGDLLVLTNGCLCCAARGDFTAALRTLLAGRARGEQAFDRVLVETTGLADPGPILNAPLIDPGLWAACRVGPLLTLVDASDGVAMLGRRAEAARQVALADRIVVTKTDLLGRDRASALAELERGVRRLNAVAPIVSVRDAVADAMSLLAPAEPRQDSGRACDSPAGVGVPSHAGVESGVLRAGRLDARLLDRFLALLRARHGGSILRLKGLVALADAPETPVVVQLVGHMLHPATRLRAWPAGERDTRLVVIVEGMRVAAVYALWDTFFGPPAIDRPDAAALAPRDPEGAGLFG